MTETKTAEDARRGTASSAWRDVRKLLWRHRYRLLGGFALLSLGRVAALVLPASSKYLVDEVVSAGRGELLTPLAAAIVIAALVQGATSLALARVLGVAAQRTIMQIRRQLQEHVVHLPVHYFDRTRSGELISRIMTDPEGVRNLLGNGLIQFAGSVLSSLLAFAVLVYLNWRLTAITVTLLAVFAGLMVFSFRRLRPLHRERAELNARLTGRLAESLNGIRVVKAYGAERREQLAFAHHIHAVFRNIAREITLSSAIGVAATLIFSLITATLLLLGGHSILTGAMTLGDFVMFVFFIGLLITPVARMADTSTQLSGAMAGLDRMRELQEIATEDAVDDRREPVGMIAGELEFQGVSYEYEPGVPVLKDISFRAAPGTTTALVGPSGAGKSTLIGLIMAFDRPLSGRVLLDGRDLGLLRRREYRAHLGVVLQDNFLFDGSIAENVAYSKPHASHEEIVAASRIAHCHDFVESFEAGYDTLVGERGVKLSGGQRQRVAIARAILADPRILILDEATSSLDSESEALIQDGLRTLRRGRTAFVIAHRLSTVRSADQILVLEGGRIVERGTHQTLLERRGRYRQLHELQHLAAGDRFVNPGEEPPEESDPGGERAPQTDELERETAAGRVSRLLPRRPGADRL